MKTGLAGIVALGFMLLAAVSGDHSGNLRRMEVTQDDLRQSDLTEAAKWQRHPAPQEMGVLLNNPLALGLDKTDSIVKHRLAQNLEFMSEDASRINGPRTDELRAWLKNNQQRFQGVPRISFRQLCFSFARNGKRAQAEAGHAFRMVSGQPVDSGAGVANLADHFTLQSYYGDRTPEQIAKVFGAMFVRSLFVLKTGSWQGPIESELGWHLVWIDTLTVGRVASFSEVESDPNGSPSNAPKRAAGRLTQ